jgi:precorrin-4/cobalt-precorrin-4 C11-methyltransferase
VAICYRIGWPDEKIVVVPLATMATTTVEQDLIRTTLYVISPALGEAKVRSQLYNPTHSHLFRSRTQPSPEVEGSLKLGH